MLFNILLLVILIGCNGIFSASELAFLSLNKRRLKEEVEKKNKKAIKIHTLLSEPGKFLAAIQIGVTIAGFLASAFAAETFADEIVQHMGNIQIQEDVLKTIIVVVITILLSYITLVFGELIPKKIAISTPEKVAYTTVGLIYTVTKIAKPFIFILTKSTDLVANIFGIKKDVESKITEEDIKMMIQEGRETGTINENEKNLIFNVFKLNDIEIAKIMTPKDMVISINVNITIKELNEFIKKYKYTRFPVYENNINNVIGVLNVKDIINFHSENRSFNLREIIRKPYYVHEKEKVDKIFKEMQEQRQNMGIVVTKNLMFSGIVTTEDMIEEIVGNIFDEYDVL